jgi:hypothetical protein
MAGFAAAHGLDGNPIVILAVRDEKDHRFVKY